MLLLLQFILSFSDQQNDAYSYKTRLPSNLRRTTRECMHYASSLVFTWQRWYTMLHQSISHIRKPHATRKRHDFMIFRTGLPIKVFHCTNEDFRPFAPRNWPWSDDLHIQIYKLNPCSWRYTGCANM